MAQQIKHFGTSGEIAGLIKDVNSWLARNDNSLKVVAVGESQGGRLGDEADPFYYSFNVVYATIPGGTEVDEP